jgi:hypothetical protein
MSDRQSIAGAYLKIAAHEELCAERYRGINEKLSWMLGAMATMVLTLLAWALVQLYALQPARTSAPRATVDVSTAPEKLAPDQFPVA